MGKVIDLKGQKFSRLLVLELADNGGRNRSATWKCLCDCGNTRIISSNSLRRGHTVSCGCYNTERISKDWLGEKNPTHGKPRRKAFLFLKNQYASTLEKQNGKCAICKKDEVRVSKQSGKIIRMPIDHDHKTDKIRGIICSKCNLLLGNSNDDIVILQSAIDYLRLHGNK